MSSGAPAARRKNSPADRATSAELLRKTAPASAKPDRIRARGRVRRDSFNEAGSRCVPFFERMN
jgi:hypothetical protein